VIDTRLGTVVGHNARCQGRLVHAFLVPAAQLQHLLPAGNALFLQIGAVYQLDLREQRQDLFSGHVSFPRFLHVVIRKWNTTLQTSVNDRPTFVNQISS